MVYQGDFELGSQGKGRRLETQGLQEFPWTQALTEIAQAYMEGVSVLSPQGTYLLCKHNYTVIHTTPRLFTNSIVLVLSLLL